MLLVATLLRDGLFDPGGIGLPPSLTIQGGLCNTSPNLRLALVGFPDGLARQRRIEREVPSRLCASRQDTIGGGTGT